MGRTLPPLSVWILSILLCLNLFVCYIPTFGEETKFVGGGELGVENELEIHEQATLTSKMSWKPSPAILNNYRKRELQCRINCNFESYEYIEDNTDEMLHNVRKTRCLKECISKQCFRLIYGNYELEPGEVDGRETSFKRCVYGEISSALVKQRRDWKTSSAISYIFTSSVILQLFTTVSLLSISFVIV